MLFLHGIIEQIYELLPPPPQEKPKKHKDRVLVTRPTFSVNAGTGGAVPGAGRGGGRRALGVSVADVVRRQGLEAEVDLGGGSGGPGQSHLRDRLNHR